MKKLFLLSICLFWAWKAGAEPGSASVTVSVDGSGQLASKIAENGTPVADIGHLTVVGGGTLVFSDFYYIASNMNTTLLTLDVSGVSIGNEALGLENCVCLTDLILPPAIGGNFSSNALRGDSSLTAISIPDGVTLLKWDTFRGCTSLETVSIAKTVATINNSDYASVVFSELESLKSISVHPDNPNYSSDGGVLFNKDQTKLYVYPVQKPESSYAIPEGVTTLYALNASNLNSLTIPASLTQIGGGTFAGCTALTSFAVASGNPTLSFDAAGVLFNKAQTRLISYPVKRLDTHYTIPAGVDTIGDHAFLSCAALETVTIPSSVQAIEKSAFSGAANLLSVHIPEGVDSIMWDTFAGCTALETVHIPSTVTKIRSWAFYKCRPQHVYVYNATPPEMEGDFDCCWPFFNGESGDVLQNDLSASTLHVPAGSVAAYEADAKWQKFGTKQAIGVPAIVKLLGSDNSPVISPEARVWFYLIDPGSPTEAIQAAAMADGVGMYMATVPEGSTYIVGAENVPGHLTTYYAGGQGATQSHQATLLTQSEGMPPITLRMTAAPPPESGAITISGHVYDDSDRQKARVARNASVGIYYSKKSKPTSKRFEPDLNEWTLIRTVTPDEDAYYILQNLPAGRYLIVADIPGYDLAGAYSHDAENGGTFHDNDFFVNDYAQIITISDNPTAAPTQENATFHLYPNPFKGTLHLTGAAGSALTIVTPTGATVHTQKVVHEDETLHLEHLPAGLYLLLLDKDNKRQTRKIVNNE